MLVVVSGLPGTGKSAVAAALAARSGAVHVSIDPIEDALLGAGLPRSWETGVAAYGAARAVAEQNLVLGRPVVVDAVNDTEPARDTWRAASAAAGADLAFVLLTLDDKAEHRRRLHGRQRTLAHVPEPSWDEVTARAAAYAPWVDGTCLRVDAGRPVDEVVIEVVDRLPGRWLPGRPMRSAGDAHDPVTRRTTDSGSTRSSAATGRHGNSGT
ncbi:AAA domain-containing protein [Blastococcus sp. DSM 46786]|uniref:AAA family ATPase n=1 Tax=Blastococcus sp. DSM 46786 TaxID=1798227 RepID=UPI0008CB1C51|nr:AAA family ATPase [Blastococcus sp. DSM 46786]SEM07526.1 AAA domain-containing protein [Blastococcus sp. DSM 46786]